MGVRVVVKEDVIESIRESVRVRGGPAATTTTTPGRGVTCEITIDAAAIASAVGAATKGIAREPGDVYALSLIHI